MPESHNVVMTKARKIIKKAKECECAQEPKYICDAHAKVLFGKCVRKNCKTCAKLKNRYKETILDKASKITSKARPSKYGTPKVNHGRTAAFWSIYLGIELSARQVCIMNMLQKISRDMHSPQEDNLIDIAGFAYNADVVQEKRKKH